MHDDDLDRRDREAEYAPVCKEFGCAQLAVDPVYGVCGYHRGEKFKDRQPPQPRTVHGGGVPDRIREP